MSYATSSLVMAAQAAGAIGAKIWFLDTVDTIGDVNTAGFISDGKKKGMEKGDIVFVRIWTTAIPAATSEKVTADGTANDLTAVHMCWCIGISTAGAADLTDGLAVTATNTD